MVIKPKVSGKLIFFVLVGLVFSLSQARADPYPQVEPKETQGPPLISMDFQDADLKDVLKVFSQQSGLNFIASEKVEMRKLTLYLENVTVEDALNNILQAGDLVYERAPDSDIFIVKEYVVPKVRTQTRIFTLKYAEAYKKPERRREEVEWAPGEGMLGVAEGGERGKEADIVGVLRAMLSPHGSIEVYRRTNSLIITDIPANFPIIEQTIAKLDVPSPQVMIEVEILETSLATLQAIGLEWGGDTGQLFSFNLAGRKTLFPFRKVYADRDLGGTDAIPDDLLGQLGTHDISLVLEMLAKDTETEVLAMPRVLTLNNETAEIRISADRAVGTRTITTGEAAAAAATEEAERMETGVILKVTPTINEDDRITMLIEPEYSTVKAAKVSGYWDPHRRSAKTTVMVDDGETIVIGGLIESENETIARKVPLLGDIPVLGLLFRKKDVDRTDKELLIFITPYVVRKETLSAKAGGTILEPALTYPQKRAAVQKAMWEAKATVPLAGLREQEPIALDRSPRGAWERLLSRRRSLR